MASDKTRALFAFAKLAIGLAAGYFMLVMWQGARGDMDEALFPGLGWAVPYAAGLIVAVMVYILLSKFSKGSGND